VKLITYVPGHRECSPKQFSRNRARLARLPSSKRFEQLVFPHGGTSLFPLFPPILERTRSILAPGSVDGSAQFNGAYMTFRSVWGDPVPGGTDQGDAKDSWF
jgi:hypothetical protein